MVVALFTRSNRRRRAEIDQRDAALMLLAQAIKDTESQPWASTFRDRLKETLRDQEGSEYLRKLLREHRDLQLRPEGSDRRPPHPMSEPLPT